MVPLSQLVEKWIEEQVATEKKILLDNIEHILWILQSSSIPKANYSIGNTSKRHFLE